MARLGNASDFVQFGETADGRLGADLVEELDAVADDGHVDRDGAVDAAQAPLAADAAVSEEKNSKESPASTGVVDKTAVRRRNFPQLVSFIRSLPLIYSTHLVMNRPNNQI